MAEPDQLYAALAHVIRHWRLEAGKSQEEVYRAVRLSKNVYIRLEESVGTFSARQLAAIAAIYQRRGWELLREAENLADTGEIPQLPRSVREWRRKFG
jgi:transcriptional regulator with XRE-family HTH domain